MAWYQCSLTLAARKRGCHLITEDIVHAVPELASLDMGLLHVFIQHTSASLSVNENTDPDVRRDMETVLNRLVPEGAAYKHADEGPDDMPAHAKASLMGASVTLPVTAGGLALGTWQGVYLCEHREHGGPRRLVLTLTGQPRLAAAAAAAGSARSK